MSTILVLGIGNLTRGDDAVGRHVVRALRARGLPDEVVVEELRGELASLIEAWSEREALVVVDATQSGSPPGEIQCFDVASRPLPADTLHCSTHAMGLSEAIELSRAMGTLPRKCVVVGVEGRWFEHGANLTDAVRDAVKPAADIVMARLRAWT